MMQVFFPVHSTGTKQSSNKFHLINKILTWPQAQNYCRQHHTDLVCGPSQLQDKEFIQLKSEIKSQENLWIGLFRDTWRWFLSETGIWK